MASGWWDDNGAISGCVAAYRAIGAASLAASYSNLQSPGTFDASPGVAPTFSAATGWTFNGTTQYLTTGITPANTQAWSLLVRFSNGPTASTQCLIGSSASGGAAPYFLLFPYWAGGLNGLYGNGNYRAFLTGLTSGVIGFGGNQSYQNGSAVGATIPSNAGTIPAIYIGARNTNGTMEYPISAKVQAVVIYSSVLTAGNVATLTTAMNALAASSSHPSILHAAQRAAFA